MSKEQYLQMKSDLNSLNRRQYDKKKQMKDLGKKISACQQRLDRNKVISPEGHPGAVYVPVAAVETLISLRSSISRVQRELNKNAYVISQLQSSIAVSKMQYKVEKLCKEVKERDLGSALKVEDLKDQAEPFLTEKTKQALSNVDKRYSILRADSEGRAYVYAQCLYIGKTVPVSQVEKGIKFVAEKVNELGEAGEIVSALSHFIKFDLHIDTLEEPKCIVLCYVHVPLATYEKAMKDLKSYGAFQEGSIPE